MRTEGSKQEKGGSGSLRDWAELFWAFLKLGLFTIGGGLAMVPQMQQLAVEDHHWLTEEEVIDCIAVSQSLPGVIAINMATYIGRKLYGFRGAVIATIGVILPSFVIITLAVLLLGAIGDNPWLNGAFLGVKAAICGLILVSAVRMGKQILHTAFQWVMMIAALVSIGVFGINAVWVILAAAILGILWSLRKPKPEPEQLESARKIDEQPAAARKIDEPAAARKIDEPAAAQNADTVLRKEVDR